MNLHDRAAFERKLAAYVVTLNSAGVSGCIVRSGANHEAQHNAHCELVSWVDNYVNQRLKDAGVDPERGNQDAPPIADISGGN